MKFYQHDDKSIAFSIAMIQINHERIEVSILTQNREIVKLKKKFHFDGQLAS